MKTDKKRIGELHADHQFWQSETSLYSDEIKFFQKRLDEVAKKNTNPEILKQVEHFQNQLIIQKEQLDILNHEVKEHEQFLAGFAADHPVAIEHQLFANHDTMLTKIDMYKKLFTQFKKEFSHFLSIVM